MEKYFLEQIMSIITDLNEAIDTGEISSSYGEEQAKITAFNEIALIITNYKKAVDS